VVNNGSFMKTVILLVLGIPALLASRGDRSPYFQDCLYATTQNVCIQAPQLYTPTLGMSITRWSCQDDAKYQCMFQHVHHLQQHDEDLVQYYGKWPFVRLFGIQEPASVVFSLGNLYGHVMHAALVYKVPRTYPYRWLLIGFLLVGMNTWLWSAVFHVRDMPWTEKLDYFSAGFGVLYATYFSVIRALGVTSRKWQMWLGGMLVPLYLAHVYYLSAYKFDYTYNMTANVVVGMLHNVVWLLWSYWQWKRRRDAWMPVASVVYISAAMSLELLDFPPWWFVLDAHSLWHAATIPLVTFWYRFWLSDVDYTIKQLKRTQNLSM
jgi:hypothetical protein